MQLEKNDIHNSVEGNLYTLVGQLNSTTVAPSSNACVTLYTLLESPPTRLVNSLAVGIQIPEHSTDRRWGLLANHRSVIGPVRTRWPAADLLDFTFVVTRVNRGVNGSGYDTVLHPVDQVSEVVAREASIGLLFIGGAVSSTRRDVNTLPVVEFLVTILE